MIETIYDQIEHLCEVMHDAYEKAAAGNGWGTNLASRKPWADVPEANKATMRIAVVALLEAALPHLRVQETRTSLIAERTGENGLAEWLEEVFSTDEDTITWEMAAKALFGLGAVREESPAPRPVVDREALIDAIHEAAVAADLAKYFKHGDLRRFADAALALLPTEEDTKGRHGPIGVLGTDVGAFIECSCGKNPTPKIWLEEHWAGDPETGKQLVRQLLPASEDTKATVCTCRTVAPSGWDTVQQVVDSRCPLHTADAKREGS